MTKVHFNVVGQMPRPNRKAYPNRIIEMPSVPRVGDEIQLGHEEDPNFIEVTVRTVVWTPDEPDYDVYVVLGDPPR